MKVVKNINNNVAICLDKSGHEIVVFAKGIGFIKPPQEVSLAQVEKTYYGIDPTYLQMLTSISEEMLTLANQIITFAFQCINKSLNPNVVITLADHIQFAIRRHQQHMDLHLPALVDIPFLFEAEMDVGRHALALIKKQFHVTLPEEEATYIALHIINAESTPEAPQQQKTDEEHIAEIVSVISREMSLQINTHNFNYSRFVTHMQYLLKRGRKNELVNTENSSMYDDFAATYPKIHRCAQEVGKYLQSALGLDLTKEEYLYLMMHINRLCAHEDCYQ